MNDSLKFDYEFNGQKFALTEDAYLDGTIDHPQYIASCVDESGNDYKMHWDILDCWLTDGGEYNGECDDAAEMCNWDKPTGVYEGDEEEISSFSCVLKRTVIYG